MQDLEHLIAAAPLLAREAAEAGDPGKALNYLKLGEAAAALARREPGRGGDPELELEALLEAIAQLAGALAAALLDSPETAPQAFTAFVAAWRAERLPGAPAAAAQALARRTLQIYLETGVA